MSDSVILWEEEGTGAFNSWRERVVLTKRANESLVISVVRESIDDDYPLGRVYRSKPFKTHQRFFDEMRRAAEEAGRGEYTTTEIIRALSRVIELDAVLAGRLLRVFSRSFQTDGHRQLDLLAD